MDLDGIAEPVIARQVVQLDRGQLPVGVLLGRRGDGDGRLGGRPGLDQADILQRHPGQRIGVSDPQAVEKIRQIVVEVGQANRQLPEGPASTEAAPVHRGVVGGERLVNRALVGRRLFARDTEGHPAEDLGVAKTIGEGRRKINLHLIVVSNGVAIPLRPGDGHPHVGAASLKIGAGQLRETSRGGIEGKIPDRRGFEQAEGHPGGHVGIPGAVAVQIREGLAGIPLVVVIAVVPGFPVAGREIFVAEAEFPMVGTGDVKVLGHLGDLGPGPDRGVGGKDPVAIQIRKSFPWIAKAVPVRIHKRIPAAAVAVRGLGDQVIVVGIGVIDVGPNFRDRGIGAQHHLVTASPDFTAFRGKGDFRPGRFGIVIKSLGEGAIQGRLAVPLQEGPRAQDMKAVGQTVGERVMVIVLVKGHGGRVEVGDRESCQHFPFVRHGGGIRREQGFGHSAVDPDLVTELGRRDMRSEVGYAPPAARVSIGLVVAPVHFRNLGLPPTQAAGSFRPGSAVGGVINKHSKVGKIGGGFGPNHPVAAVGVELGRRGATQPFDCIIGVVVGKRDLVAIFRLPIVRVGSGGIDLENTIGPTSKGFRPWGSDFATVGVCGGKLFRMLPGDKVGLLVAEKNVCPPARRIVPVGGIGDSGRHRAVEIHAAIQLEQNVFGGTVCPGHNRQR